MPEARIRTPLVQPSRRGRPVNRGRHQPRQPYQCRSVPLRVAGVAVLIRNTPFSPDAPPQSPQLIEVVRGVLLGLTPPPSARCVRSSQEEVEPAMPGVLEKLLPRDRTRDRPPERWRSPGTWNFRISSTATVQMP